MFSKIFMANSCRAARCSIVAPVSFMAAVMLAAAPLHAGAVDGTTNGTTTGTSNGSTSSGQSGGGSPSAGKSTAFPTSGGTIYVSNGGTATITAPGAACTNLYVGDPNNAGGGTIQMSSGSLSVSTNEYVGNSGPGTFIQSGGTNTVGSGGLLYVGLNAGVSGAYVLSGSGLLVAAPYSCEFVGTNGSGTFTQSGGTNSITGFLELGVNSGGSGTYSLNSGLVSAAAGDEFVGNSGSGTFTQSGGTNNMAGSLLFLGYNAGSSGAYNLKGGVLTAEFAYVGYSGSGVFTQSGGTNTIGSTFQIGATAGSSGTYNLDGGVLVVPSLVEGSTAAAFHLNGGTLRAGNAFSSSLPMTLGTSGGGATVDTAGYAITLSGPLSGPGSLAKIGNGALTLSGSDTYTGPTTIGQGKLVDDGWLEDSAVSVNGGTLGGTGYLASVTVKAGGHLAPGDLNADTGALVIAGGLNIQGGEFDVLAAGRSVSNVSIMGNLSLNDASTLDVTGGLSGGPYTIASYDGTLSGKFAAIDVPAGYTVNYGTGRDSSITLRAAAELSAVPEPSTFLLLCAGALGLLGYAWRRRPVPVNG
jgi:autotransporter-associated beta strand protein